MLGPFVLQVLFLIFFWVVVIILLCPCYYLYFAIEYCLDINKRVAVGQRRAAGDQGRFLWGQQDCEWAQTPENTSGS